MCAQFVTSFVDFCISVLGWMVCPLFVFVSILCSLKALLSIKEENRIFYKKLCRIIGFILPVLALMAHFRDLSWIAFFIALGWTVVFGCFIKPFYSYQVLGISIINLIYWISHVVHAQKDFMTNAPDFLVFAILPDVLGIVLISSSDYIASGPKDGSLIPLSHFINKITDIVNNLIPTD